MYGGAGGRGSRGRNPEGPRGRTCDHALDYFEAGFLLWLVWLATHCH
jgi:hypothetical protein